MSSSLASSLSPSHQAEIDSLVQSIQKDNPTDIVQYCFNHFHNRLSTERVTHRSSQDGGTMTDTASPFGNPFGTANKAQAIQEEDEERDSFGSPTNASFPQSTFNASPFGAAGTSSGGFGNWLSQQSSEQDATAQAMPNNYAAGRRTSVSAESMQPDAGSGEFKPPKHPKTDDQLQRLKAAVANNFLFTQLDEESFSLILDALMEKPIPAPNIKVISQGDEGDYFYIVESGEFDIYINPAGSVQPGAEGMGNKIATIGPGGSFGELALMYNAPRAATVVSTTKGSLLWALDRVTFRRILMDKSFQRRKMYEAFLEDVHLLSGLTSYDRAKIADALESVKYSEGQNIITEGEPGEYFYILEQGSAAAYKHGVDHPVKEYGRGEFFGELALLDDKPRAASVVAKSDAKVARLGRDGFKRLLGPVENIMRREDYAKDELDPLTKQTTYT